MSSAPGVRGQRYVTLGWNRFVDRPELNGRSTPELTRIDLLRKRCRDPIERTKELMKRVIPARVQRRCLYWRPPIRTKPGSLVINYLTKRIYFKDSRVTNSCPRQTLAQI